MSQCEYCLGESVGPFPVCPDCAIAGGGLADAQQMVKAFHRKFGCTIGETPAVRDADLRADLVAEESLEMETALYDGNIVETVDGLCDLIYVALGTAVAMGVDLWPIFREIHRSNMSKTADNKRADGKIAKGPEYSPPDVLGELIKQGFKP